MATFHKFEEIEGWQMARQLTREIYAIFNQLNNLSIETAQKIGGLIKYLRSTEIRGSKYK